MNYIQRLMSENKEKDLLLKEAEARLREATNLVKNHPERQPLAKDLVEQLTPITNKLENHVEAQEVKEAPKQKRAYRRRQPDAIASSTDEDKYQRMLEGLEAAKQLIEALKPLIK